MSVLMSFANIINLIIENWIIAVAALAVFASVLLGLFKGIKHGIRALVAVTVIAVVALCAFTVYYFIKKDIEGLIKFGIAWLPTIIFVLIILISLITGLRRGLRKSLILFLQSLIAAGLCLGAYFFCITSTAVDKFLVDVVNTFMGEGGLQSQLGVSSECETMRQVLIAYFNDFTVDMGEIGILLRANSPYILTLINMAYRIVFALLFYIIYLLLVLILYVVYHIFYPERRYRKKRNMKFAAGKADSSYKKRSVGGGCVGMVRGAISGTIIMSFIGSIFFILSGGTGASKLPEDISFGEDYQPLVSIYRSIEDYGEQGIFKVLNAVDDPRDMPYYLFAADLVFSGGLDDSEHGVTGNIKFREELAAYTGFAKNTLALLLKHDSSGDIAAILKGEGDADIGDSMGKVLEVCKSPAFKVEFNNLIDNFDSQTYIINFALSLADSVIANADELSFMSSVSADNKDLLKVMFANGYLSDVIPDERELKHAASGAVSGYNPPHLTINHLFTKNDAQIILDVVLSVLANEIDMEEPVTLARVLIPYIEQLSIFGSERSAEMDPVLGRLYCYFDNKYLTEEGEDGIRYSEIKKESVSWTREIRALLGVSDGLFTLYESVAGAEEGDGILSNVAAFFDESNENYEENVKIYEELTEVVSDSALISKVLCSKKVYAYMTEAFGGISENFYLPEKIVYENKYDADGNLVSRGEAYQLLRGLRLLADKDNKDVMDALTNGDVDFKELIDKIAHTITADDPNAHGNSLASYLTESVILRSALSSIIIERAGDMLKVPTLSRETNSAGEVVQLVNKAELREIFDALPALADLLIPLTEEEVTAEAINDILENETFNSLIRGGNKIVEGTVAQSLIDMLSEHSTVIISKRLENYEEWLTVNEAGELRNFLDVIDILELDIKGIMDGGSLNGTEIYDKLKILAAERIDSLLKSEVFYYSSSKLMDNGDFGAGDDFTVIVPSSSCVTLEGDKLDRIIKKAELSSVFKELNNLGLSSDMENEDIVRQLTVKKSVLKESAIISASVVNFIVTHENICDSLKVPALYMEAGAEVNLKEYEATNIWRRELPNMIDAIDEIFLVSEGGEFSFNGDTISEKTNDLLKSLNEPAHTAPSVTRLQVCYASDIMKNNITIELDSALDGVVDGDVIDGAKSGGYYKEEELRSLSETAGIFDLDILKIDNNELSDKVKKQILTINDKREDGRSTLDVMYPSAIIRFFVTDEIDKALNGENQTDETLIDISVRDSFKTGANNVYPKEEVAALADALNALGVENIDDGVPSDKFTSVSGYKANIDTVCASGIATGIITKKIDESLTDDKIDPKVRAQIKGRNKVYPSKEIVALIDALDELEIDDFNGFDNDFSKLLNGLDTAPSKSESGKTKLDVIYLSDIAVGVFTKSVKDVFDGSGGTLVYHTSAQRTDLAVLKKSEISALISLLGDVDLEHFNVGALSLETVKTQLKPDASGNPSSYLISANFTATTVKNPALYVPSGVCKRNLIDAAESVKLIDAIVALQGDRPFDDWDVEGDMILPDRERREAVLDSAIMRATFSHYVFVNEGNADIAFARGNVDVTDRRVEEGCVETYKLPVISRYQLEVMFDIIGTAGADLQIPLFASVTEIDMDRLDLFYELDVTRYSMSKTIMDNDYLAALLYLPEYKEYILTEQVYRFDIGDGVVLATESEERALTKEGIIKLLSMPAI